MFNNDMFRNRKRLTPEKNYNLKSRPVKVSQIVMEERIDLLRKVDIELIYRLRMYEQTIAAAAQNASELNNQLNLLSNFSTLAKTLAKNTVCGVKNSAIRASYHYGMGVAKIACTPVVLIPYLGPKLWACAEFIAGSAKEQLINYTGTYKTVMPVTKNKAFEDVYRAAYERYLIDMGAYGYMSKLFKTNGSAIQTKIREEFTPTTTAQDKAKEFLDKTRKDILKYLHFALPVNLDQAGVDLKEGYNVAKDAALAALHAKSSNTP